MKRIDIINRIIDEAEYTISNRTTVRETAKHFGVSKSTIWKNIAIDLKDIDLILFERANDIINTNKSERATHGGQATKTKFCIKRKFDQMSFDHMTNLKTKEDIREFLQYASEYPKSIIDKILESDAKRGQISLYKLNMIKNLLNDLKNHKLMFTDSFLYNDINEKINSVFEKIPNNMI